MNATAIEQRTAIDGYELLTTRTSSARLVEPGPSEAELQKILYAAACAPDHGRKTPWRFVVVSGSSRARFGELMAASLQRRDPNASPAKLQLERDKPMRAPLIVVTAAVTREDPAVPGVEQILAVGAATQNILLAAHALGYGSFWRTGATARDDSVKEGLGLAPENTIVGFIYIGTSEVPARPRQVELGAVTMRLTTNGE
ncbi:MAG TPA: nitroreductase [Ramlibacter sp.]|nr:nitroreductase [Ramlibacter sp.]